MASRDIELFDQLKAADRAENWALARFLGEKHLDVFPNHGPTLVSYARSLITFAQYERASEVLNHAENVVEGQAMVYVYAMRGALLDDQGRHAEAEQVFMKAHEMAPTDASYLIQAASSAYRTGNHPRAELLAQQAVECDDDLLDEAYFILAGANLAQGRFKRAREYYIKALEIDPDYEIAKKRLVDLDLLLEAQKKQA